MGAEGAAGLPWDGLAARWLASRDMGAQFGGAVDVLLAPGESYAPYRHARHERVVYVWEGVGGMHFGSGGEIQLAADDVLVIPPGSWHGFENNGSAPTRLWIAWQPGPEFPLDDYETGGGKRDYDGDIIRHRLRQSAEDPDSTPAERGFEKVGIIWDGALGAKAITLGWAHFDAGGVHHMHRHPNADEAMCITVGSGEHVTPDRHRTMLGSHYDPEFAAAGEWHQFLTADEHTEGIFFYLGAATLDGTGYELAERQSPGASGVS